ncbi:MAG: tetratricopeptide repeat protein [Kaiparowitsia implicata GSE-PSE-MK54-09C]|jgi:tetratricopeptide (TPR) repeat protein|nr:tetratricopeptide repeat protein [Kaiparowitsia implicata GSE-PSE-MK54-09C]
MTDYLSDILERIASGEYSKADMVALQQALKGEKGRSLLQLGKYNITIGEGRDIQIGDRTYVEINDAAVQAIIAAIRQVPLPAQSHIWMVPASRNPFYTGRKTLLAEMRTSLVAGQTTAFCGLGGMGKTQMAIEYIYRHRADYEVVLWVRAEQAGEFSSGLVEVAKALALPISQEQDETLIISAVKSWLKQHQNWLLVIDNADDLTVVQTFLRGIDTGHILLTSRAQATGAIKRIEIQQMIPEEGALLLLRRAKLIREQEEWNLATTKTQALAIKIATQMDGLPLALDQAGAFIEETFTSLEGYLAFYEAEGVKLLSERGELTDDHPSVTVTFSLAFEKVMERNLAAADLLRACAFLAPDDIPEELLGETASELGGHLKKLSERPLELTKALAEASRFSLLYRNAENRTFSIHRLVQEVLRARMSLDECCLWVERIVRSLNQVFPEPDYPNWSLCDRLLPHSKAAATFVDLYQLQFEAVGNLWDKTARYLRERGQYVEAKPLLQSALALRQKLLGETHPDVATSLNNLASLYKDQRQYGESELLYRQSLEIRQLLVGEENLDTATSLNDLAVVLKAIDKYKEAELLHLKALETRRKLLGDDHLDVAESLNNLGALYFAQGYYKEAESLFEKSLGLKKKLLGEKHPRTINSLNSLAILYHKQTRYEEAEVIYHQVISLSSEIFGEFSHQRADYLNNLADFYNSQKKFLLAETYLKESLSIQQHFLGEDHPTIAIILNNLGALNEDLEKFNEAEAFYRRALEIKVQAYGKGNSSVGISLNNLAKFYVGQQQYKQAEQFYLEALEIFESSLGSHHPYFKQVHSNLDELLKVIDKH